MQEVQIRRSKIYELHVLQKIEVSAGKIFADYDMDDVTNDDPPSISTLVECCRHERLWVHTDSSDYPIAYVMTEIVDGCVHIEQISVHSKHSGKGVGKALIEHLQQHAKKNEFSAVTLTTFRDLPWNAPYYERLGFLVLEEHEITPGLAKVRMNEEKLGLDRWPRVCMKLIL